MFLLVGVLAKYATSEIDENEKMFKVNTKPQSCILVSLDKSNNLGSRNILTNYDTVQISLISVTI